MFFTLSSLGALASIITAILALSKHLDRTLPRSQSAALGTWLTRTAAASFSDLAGSINHWFITLFDRVYAPRQRRLNFWPWALIAGIFVFAGLVSPLARLEGLGRLELATSLQLGLLFGASFAAALLGKSVEIIGISVAVVGMLTALVALSRALKIPYEVIPVDRQSSDPRSVIILVLLGVVLLVRGRRFLARQPLVKRIAIICAGVGGLVGLFFLLRANMGAQEIRRVDPWVVMLFGLIAVIFVGSAYGLRRARSYLLRISPFRVLLTSVGAMFLIGMLVPESGIELLREIRIGGMAVLSLLILNLSVDSISLLETRLLLGLPGRWTVPKVLGVLVCDAFVSAELFLAIPLAAGDPDVSKAFVHAIAFRGDRPWLGILFWSSMSTSAILYLYVTTIGLLFAGHGLLRRWSAFGHVLPMKRRPLLSLGIIAAGIVVIAYCTAAVVRMIW
jgi:hypothetical protein